MLNYQRVCWQLLVYSKKKLTRNRSHRFLDFWLNSPSMIVDACGCLWMLVDACGWTSNKISGATWPTVLRVPAEPPNKYRSVSSRLGGFVQWFRTCSRYKTNMIWPFCECGLGPKMIWHTKVTCSFILNPIALITPRMFTLHICTVCIYIYTYHIHITVYAQKYGYAWKIKRPVRRLRSIVGTSHPPISPTNIPKYPLKVSSSPQTRTRGTHDVLHWLAPCTPLHPGHEGFPPGTIGETPLASVQHPAHGTPGVVLL